MYAAAREALKVLNRFQEAEFVTVLSKYKPDDKRVEIVFACPDSLRGVHLDSEGRPYGLASRVEESLANLSSKHKATFEIIYCWADEFRKRLVQNFKVGPVPVFSNSDVPRPFKSD